MYFPIWIAAIMNWIHNQCHLKMSPGIEMVQAKFNCCFMRQLQLKLKSKTKSVLHTAVGTRRTQTGVQQTYQTVGLYNGHIQLLKPPTHPDLIDCASFILF